MPDALTKQGSLEASKTLGSSQRPGKPDSSPDTAATSSCNSNEIDSKLHLLPAFQDPQNEPTGEAAMGCPFASMKPAQVGDSRRTWSPYGSITPRPDDLSMPSIHPEPMPKDPIAAEFRRTGASSPPPSVNGSVSICPIRFLDQHTPEEVAEYFKHHRHEVPRSHELCVKRFQSNAASIRQLDAKYQDLGSVLQGLGAKHQPLLHTKEEADIMATQRTLREPDSLTEQRDSIAKVEDWAHTVEKMEDAKSNDPANQPSPSSREGHFDRVFKEVRVGESPSRPWGISVPMIERAARTESLEKGPKDSASLMQDTSKYLTTRKEKDEINPVTLYHCPRDLCLQSSENDFATLEQMAVHILNGHQWGEQSFPTNAPIGRESVAGLTGGDQPATLRKNPHIPSEPTSYELTTRRTSQVTFNGPVFFGYPADQAAVLLGLSAMNPSRP